MSKPRLPPPPLPLDEALAEIRSSTASIIDFQASLVIVIVMVMVMAMAMAMAMPLWKPPHRRPHQLLDQRLKLGRAPEQVLLRPHPIPPPSPSPHPLPLHRACA